MLGSSFGLCLSFGFSEKSYKYKMGKKKKTETEKKTEKKMEKKIKGSVKRWLEESR